MAKRAEIPSVNDIRYDIGGTIVYHGTVNGYYILARPGCVPFPSTPDRWEEYSREPVSLFDSLPLAA